jgi:hypothetical protein
MVGLQFVVSKRVPRLHNCTFRRFWNAARDSFWTAFAFAATFNMWAVTVAKFLRACSIACAGNYSIADKSTVCGLPTLTRSLDKLRCQNFAHHRDWSFAACPSFGLAAAPKAPRVFYCATRDNFAMNLIFRQTD